MGKQELDKDRVTSLLQSDEWEDDQTATTAATTVADSDSEEEDEVNPEVSFEDENKYREPPAEPMYNGQGTSNIGANVHGARVQPATRDTTKDRASSSEKSSKSKSKISKVKVVTPDVAERTVQSAAKSNETKRTVHSNPDVAKGTAQSVLRSNGTKSTVQSTDELAEATTKQQRTEDPRHWLQVPVNNLTEGEEVAKRKALAKELMGEEANKPVKIRGLMVPRMRALDHPAAPLLKEYASQGCPVDVGRDWTLEELEAAVEKGPHSSALEPDAIEQIQVEARDKAKQGFAKIYSWEWLKKNIHKHPPA